MSDILVALTAVFVTICFLYLVCDWLLRRRILAGAGTGRYVLITGCDSGFGKCAALRFDAVGCHVFATCLTPAGVVALRETCSSRMTALEMDVTKEDSIQQAFSIVSRVLQPDKGPLEWLSVSDITQLFKVNLFGMCRVVRTFLPLLKRSCGGGRIVNTASILGRLNIPFAAPYCMTKCAIESYSDALRVELNPYNIHVAIIEPGAHTTHFLSSINDSVTAPWDNLPNDVRDQFGTEYLQKVIFLGTKLIPFFGSANIDAVVDAYYHALFAVWPRRRYLVGRDAKLLQFATLLPSFIHDLVLLSPPLRAVPAACRR